MVGESSNDNDKNETFIIYYLNYSKTVDLNMTVSNAVPTALEREHTNSSSNSIDGNIRGSLGFLGSSAGGTLGAGTSESEGERVKETFEIKQTKSTQLQGLIKKARTVEFSKLSECHEGELIRIDDIRLELLDEAQIKQMQTLRHDALKGFRVQGIDLNSLINSFLQDFAYIFVGHGETAETDGDISGKKSVVDSISVDNCLAVKIPSDNKNELENNYQIQDLLLGHVSIVGVYKGRVPVQLLLSNTFNYFQSISTTPSEDGRVIKSETSPAAMNPQTSSTNHYSSDVLGYIDAIAIIQPVGLREIEYAPLVASANQRGGLISWLKRLKGSDGC